MDFNCFVFFSCFFRVPFSCFFLFFVLCFVFFFCWFSSSFALFVDDVFLCCFLFFLFTMPCLMFCYVSPTHVFQYYDYELLSKHKPTNAKCHFFCFSAGCRKCIFHISLVLSKLRHVFYKKLNMHFPMEKNIFLENLGAIKNA